jgi:hypothetical protein
MTESGTQLKERVKKWLTEEHFTIEAQNDPNTYFNFKVTRGLISVNAISTRSSIDGLLIASGMGLAPEPIKAYQD